MSGSSREPEDGFRPSADAAATPACERASGKLRALHAGRLSQAEAADVLAHLASCGVCAARFESDLAPVYALIASAPVLRPDATLREGLYARINSMRRDPRGPAARSPRRDILEDVMFGSTPPSTETAYAPRKLSTWLSGVAAVAIVALLAVVFVMHGLGTRTGPAAGNVTAADGCATSAIHAKLPANTYLTDITMVAPGEGWAVGSIVNPSNGAWVSGAILHYQHCAWTQSGDAIPSLYLASISMASPDDGWAVGTINMHETVALHYTRGAWQRVEIPAAASDGSYTKVRMLSANEGWIVMVHAKSKQGLLSYSLLHDVKGTWTAADAPLKLILDVAPVGPNDLWVSGGVSEIDQSGTLARYHDGQWTTVSVPHGGRITDLHMTASTGWASGQVQAKSGDEANATPLVLRYDGTSWSEVQTGADPAAQRVEMFGPQDGWAFTFIHPSQANGNGSYLTIAGVQRKAGIWQTVPWTATDIKTMTLVRSAPDEYWAIGYRDVFQTLQVNGGSNSGISYEVSVLLLYSGGVWTVYDK